jgi:hypothetical protein
MFTDYCSLVMACDAPRWYLCSFPFPLDRDHARGLVPGVGWKASNTCEEVKRDALLPDPYNDSLRFLIGGDHLAFLFGQWNNFRNFKLLR